MKSKIAKIKKCKGFKFPDSDIIWTPGKVKDNRIECYYETMEIIDGEEECLVTTTWFWEEQLKDAVLFP